MTAGERMYIWFLVGLGGGLGAIARYASVRGAVELGLRPDLGTGLVNVLGSFLLVYGLALLSGWLLLLRSSSSSR